jgi:hypothetical protein
MAKRLAMAEIDTILTLHKAGHSNREIAALLGVNPGDDRQVSGLRCSPKPAQRAHREFAPRSARFSGRRRRWCRLYRHLGLSPAQRAHRLGGVAADWTSERVRTVSRRF